jgi:capsular exopolysaccharide synthesis family protein
MEAETRTSWIRRLQEHTRRLLDARPPWLFRGDTNSQGEESTELIQESFRTLSANLLIHASEPCRTFLLTSPAPGEGKSTLSANLAVSLTRQRPPVLLIDADLRRPVLHKIFHLSNDCGLSDVLKGIAGPDEAIQKTQEGPDVLPSGGKPEEPISLLGSDRTRELIDELTRKYRIILFDAPPMFSATDPALLAPLVDWTLLVLRAGTTTADEARRAKSMLEAANGKVLGSILNNLDARFAPAYHKYANYYAQSSGKT